MSGSDPDVAIYGRMHTGKTTLADALIERGYRRLSFAAPLKELLDRAGVPKTRHTMQAFGDGGRELLGEDVWVNVVERTLRADTEDLSRPMADFVCDDMRYLNEMQLLRGYGFLMVKLVASDDTRWERYKTSDKYEPGKARFEWDHEQKHVTEGQLDGAKFDIVIDTEGKTPEEVLAQFDQALG